MWSIWFVMLWQQWLNSETVKLVHLEALGLGGLHVLRLVVEEESKAPEAVPFGCRVGSICSKKTIAT